MVVFSMFARNNVRFSRNAAKRPDSWCEIWGIISATGLLAFIFLVDYYFKVASPRVITIAVLDELAHLSVAIVFLLALKRVVSRWLVAGCLAGAVLIDIDHLPELFSTGTLAAQPERPVTHSLVSVVALLLIALVFSGRWRAVFLGGSLGVLTHLARDMATGGVPLLWPVRDTSIDLSYAAFAAMMVAVAIIPLLRYTAIVLATRASPREPHLASRHPTRSESSDIRLK